MQEEKVEAKEDVQCFRRRRDGQGERDGGTGAACPITHVPLFFIHPRELKDGFNSY
jgi:hypothetical protein